MEIAPFRIEEYYARHEFTTRYMLSSSDCESRPLGDLLAFEPDAEERLRAQWLGYTESPGGEEVRAAIAALYDTATPDDVVVCSAAEEAIFLVEHALLGPGRRAVVETPCYESALQLARSTGAAVDEWRRRAADGWAHDLDALERLLPGATLLYLNQPHNPTGTLMRRETFERVSELCAEHGVLLFCDEVYRELEHDPADRLPAACDLGGLSLGSVSKTYGLPGLRLGWLVTRDAELRERIVSLKHYTTICAPAPSELLTAVALRHRDVLADRSRELVNRNLPLLDELFARHGGLFAWTRPTASSIGFARAAVGDVDAFCERLAAGGVLLLPGSVYDEPGHVRFGYGRANLPEAIARLDELLA
jgi:aspartate/methionine/tyrosine aminotransferase